MILIKIKNPNGEVISSVKKPAALFDTEDGTLYKLGEYVEVKSHYERCVSIYKEFGMEDQLETLAFLELKKDQELIDNIFQDSSHLQEIYKETKVL